VRAARETEQLSVSRRSDGAADRAFDESRAPAAHLVREDGPVEWTQAALLVAALMMAVACGLALARLERPVAADVILAANPFSLAAATRATRTVPIVGLDMESDPVRQGWAATLARPGGNVTGFFLDMPEMSGKHVEFVKIVKPSLARLAVLGDPRLNALQFEVTDGAARDAGLALERLAVQSPDEIEGAIAEAARRGAGALVVFTSPLINSALPRIARAAVKHRMPSICAFAPLFAEAGGLMAYGPDFHELYRRTGAYVARILKGSAPGDLPMQRPEKFLLVINLRTARALGVTLPPSFLRRSDHVIE